MSLPNFETAITERTWYLEILSESSNQGSLKASELIMAVRSEKKVLQIEALILKDWVFSSGFI